MKTKSRLPACIIIAVGAVMMIFGAARGEVAVMLTKAIHICLECMGIG